MNFVYPKMRNFRDAVIAGSNNGTTPLFRSSNPLTGANQSATLYAVKPSSITPESIWMTVQPYDSPDRKFGPEVEIGVRNRLEDTCEAELH